MMQLVYVSRAHPPLHAVQLSAILSQSRQRNAMIGITGVLVHEAGTIMQVLEGPVIAVEALFSKIRNDPRHHGVTELLRQSSERRQFPGWPMASGPSVVDLSADWTPGRGHWSGHGSDIVDHTPGPVSRVLLSFWVRPWEGSAD